MNRMHEAVGRCADAGAYTLLLCLYTHLFQFQKCLFKKQSWQETRNSLGGWQKGYCNIDQYCSDDDDNDDDDDDDDDGLGSW